ARGVRRPRAPRPGDPVPSHVVGCRPAPDARRRPPRWSVHEETARPPDSNGRSRASENADPGRWRRWPADARRGDPRKWTRVARVEAGQRGRGPRPPWRRRSRRANRRWPHERAPTPRARARWPAAQPRLVRATFARPRAPPQAPPTPPAGAVWPAAPPALVRSHVRTSASAPACAPASEAPRSASVFDASSATARRRLSDAIAKRWAFTRAV